MKTEIQVSIGELFDKLTILMIKKEKIQDQEKLIEVNKELDILNSKVRSEILSEDFETQEFTATYNKLLEVNSELWDVEDRIREKEAQKNFRKEFISLARKVYKLNDERFSLKDRINQIFNSDIKEQKSYVSYS